MRNAIKTCCLFFIVAILAGCSTAPRYTAPPQPIQSGNAGDNDIVRYAMDLVGTPYVYGGKNPESGLDCSGLVSLVYNKAGLPLDGTAAHMAKQGKHINKSELAPGDLVFFNTLGRAYSHVGIYIGGGRFIHAPRPGSHVRISQLDNPYFSKRFDAARTYQTTLLAANTRQESNTGDMTIDEKIEQLMGR